MGTVKRLVRKARQARTVIINTTVVSAAFKAVMTVAAWYQTRELK